VSRFGTRLDARSRLLIEHMDTRAPDINLCATHAVDFAENAAFFAQTCHERCPTDFEADADINLAFVPCLAISLDIATERESGEVITVHAWQLSVTESSHSRHKKAVSMSHIEKFDLREWLVGPLLVSIALGLMIAGAIMVRW